MWVRSLSTSLLYTSFLVGLIACDTIEADKATGEFAATITGEVTEALTGTAAFGTGLDPETGEQAFSIAMVPDDGTVDPGSQIVIYRWGDRPEPGTYPLVAVDNENGGGRVTEGEFGAVIQIVDQIGTTYLWSESGSLEIVESTAIRLIGSFSVEASGSSEGAGGELEHYSIDVSGEFDAVGGADLTLPPNL